MKKPFSNFQPENWKNLILFAVFTIYCVQFGFMTLKTEFRAFTGDYLAFWSAGKIANEIGYSKTYDLEVIKSVQSQELITLGYYDETNISVVPTLPAAILSFYILPFRFLSRIYLVHSYWIWAVFNLALLTGYLYFFIQKTTLPGSSPYVRKKIFLLMLLSYPVFLNFYLSQVNVLLMICAGEFIRNSVAKKSVLSGIWLGGLLLKPQILILVVPVILIMRNWKVLFGFFISSGVILTSSVLSTGVSGMKSLLNLWTKYSAGIATSAPEVMINWRMVGVNLNSLTDTSFGYIVTGLGVICTFFFIYLLIKNNPEIGSDQWILVIFGVFSGTLAITWHSHYHMALVLLPLLVYAFFHNLIEEKMIFWWVVIPPATWLGFELIGLLVLFFTKINLYQIQWTVLGAAGFTLNLTLLISIVDYFNKSNKSRKIITEDSSLIQ